MSVTFKFFSDAGLATEAATVALQHEQGIGGDPQDTHLYLGSVTASRKIEANSDPGIANITANVVNATAERTNSTVYALGNTVRTETHNGYKYEAVTVRGTGEVAASPPVWPTTLGAQVDDDSSSGVNGITWENIGPVHEPEEVRLATSQAGFTAATPGASLALGTEILSGAGNAVDVWVRVTDATDVVAVATELSVQLNEVQETSTA